MGIFDMFVGTNEEREAKSNEGCCFQALDLKETFEVH